MNIKELMEKNRKQELKAIYAFIETCSIEELATIIAEIRCVHDNLEVFNHETKRLSPVQNISINGDCIQMNIEVSK